MQDFAYHRPASVAEAVRLMRKTTDGKYMTGGMTLLPTMKQGLATPSDVIDLSALDNSGVSVMTGKLVIRAGTPHADVATNKNVARAIPALAQLAGGIGDPHVRNRGTIGGSLANNDPAADYPAAVLSLGATVQTNSRSIAADKYFTGMFQTALKEAEIITAVEFPLPKRAGYAKFPNPASRYAMVGVFVSQMRDGSVRVAVTGAGPMVFRVPEMEAALAKSFSPDALRGIVIKPRGLNSDMHASAEYRAHLVNVMARRAVEGAK